MMWLRLSMAKGAIEVVLFAVVVALLFVMGLALTGGAAGSPIR